MPASGVHWVEALGWLGQALFFSRGLVQWLQSERAGRSISTPTFWWLSMLGTLLLTFSSAYQNEPILLASFAINLGIYARNLLLCSTRFKHLEIQPLLAAGLAAAMAYGLWAAGPPKPKDAESVGALWQAIGTLGLVLWSSRFVYQWWASERRGVSHFDAPFWWLSLAGNLPLLAYALKLGKPLYIASFLLGPLTQTRNLVLLARARRREREAQLAAPAPAEAPLPEVELAPHRSAAPLAFESQASPRVGPPRTIPPPERGPGA